jgi:uncharacterized membrane protein (DUF485 family)
MQINAFSESHAGKEANHRSVADRHLGFFAVVTLLAGYAKDIMTIKLIGSMNIGFSLILLAYVICWAGALLYARAANGPFDTKTKLVIEHDEQRKEP